MDNPVLRNNQKISNQDLVDGVFCQIHLVGVNPKDDIVRNTQQKF